MYESMDFFKFERYKAQLYSLFFTNLTLTSFTLMGFLETIFFHIQEGGGGYRKILFVKISPQNISCAYWITCVYYLRRTNLAPWLDRDEVTQDSELVDGMPATVEEVAHFGYVHDGGSPSRRSRHILDDVDRFALSANTFLQIRVYTCLRMVYNIEMKNFDTRHFDTCDVETLYIYNEYILYLRKVCRAN